jgi:hypothetical protein
VYAKTEPSDDHNPPGAPIVAADGAETDSAVAPVPSNAVAVHVPSPVTMTGVPTGTTALAAPATMVEPTTTASNAVSP